MAKKKAKTTAKRSTENASRNGNQDAGVKKKISALISSAASGAPGAEWFHKAILAAGYSLRSDKATKEDLRHYGRSIGTVIERLVETVAAVDAECAARVLEQARREVEAIKW
jgi:hypothetical protein